MNRLIFLVSNSFLFAVAMGWLEGVVVVYLRTILARRPDWKTIEVSREAATLVMMITFALFAGRDRKERWGVFLWLFGIWDIVYYICLWTWLKWPGDLLTLDTLFYIPCRWQAPVWIPVLFSLIMMLVGYYLMINRWTDCLAKGGWWALAGWLAGLCIGFANAWLNGLSHCIVSAMGMSVCLGLIAGTVGIGAALITHSPKKSRAHDLAVMTVFGGIGGVLGHIARSMFYISPYSCWWPVAAGLVFGMVALILPWRKTPNPHPAD